MVSENLDFHLHLNLDVPSVPADTPFPRLMQTMKLVADATHEKWISYAKGAPLPSGKTIHARSGAYLKSINLRQLGPYAWELSSDSPYAGAIEYGTGQRDLKKNISASWSARQVKSGPHKGQRYLIIPFRHGHPGANYGAMPQAVHDVARRLTPSHITAMRAEPTVPEGYSVLHRGRMMVGRNVYHWGGRLNDPSLGNRYQGMVRFDNPKGGHSHFLTFRVMGEWSKGWIAPARPALYPLRSAIEQTRPIAEKMIDAAFQRDLADLMQSRPAPVTSFWGALASKARQFFGGWFGGQS